MHHAACRWLDTNITRGSIGVVAVKRAQNRISQLNAGQLRLLVRFVENKVPGLTNKTVLDSYTKLLRKATVETEKRHEEEVTAVF